MTRPRASDTTRIGDDWMADAACTGRPGLPWTMDAADVIPIAAEQMRAVCDTCPVRAECLAYVDRVGIVGGWWAGADRDPDLMPVGQLAFLDLLGGAA